MVAWDLALIVSILGTGFLYVYIASRIGEDDEKLNRPFLKTFFSLMKLLLILAAFLMPIIAFGSNEALMVAQGVNTTRLENINSEALRVSIITPLIFLFTFLTFLIVQAVLSSIERRQL